LENLPVLRRAAASCRGFLRALRFRLRGDGRYRQRFFAPALVKALNGTVRASDISDHLNTLFFLAVAQRPRLLVELGTRGGESTRALLAAAETCNATLLSVDLDPCDGLALPFADRWHFEQADDVVFGRERFDAWRRTTLGDARPIDLLFLDTSHVYTHTRQELDAWMPHLAPDGLLLLHDTNMGQGAYARLDGSVASGWDNQRGVIRALEERLGRTYPENAVFSDWIDSCVLLHLPFCNGLTALKRIPASPADGEPGKRP